VKTNDEKREFYDNCANILDIEHTFNEPVPKRTRWNNRIRGNGRYPGFGLVQCFGSHVRVISKSETKIFKTYEEVYDYLSKYSLSINK
jgi:hypothetical protein